jgi:hypothetical protein
MYKLPILQKRCADGGAPEKATYQQKAYRVFINSISAIKPIFNKLLITLRTADGVITL